jgi:hypothetical protein
MVDSKDPKDLKDLNKQVPADPQARCEKDEIADEDLEKLSGGSTNVRPLDTFTFNPPPPPQGP